MKKSELEKLSFIITALLIYQLPGKEKKDVNYFRKVYKRHVEINLEIETKKLAAVGKKVTELFYSVLIIFINSRLYLTKC